MSLTEPQIKILLTYAQCNMNLSETAKKLYLHRNTATYQMQQIRKITGINPMSFIGLVTLLEVINEASN